MKSNILVSYLTYVTDNNRERRQSIFNETFSAFQNLKNDDSLVLFSIDNNSSSDIKNKLKNANTFDYYLHLKENFIDISLLYYTVKLADELNIKYLFYCYDDFLFYDFDFGKDCISFLDNNPDVHNIRMPYYSYDNREYFDSSKTSKSINPDAIRHYNQPDNRKELDFTGPIVENNHTFYKCNWHYTSRPTLWRTSYFKTIFEDLEKIPVMQNFEGYAMNYFYNKNLNSSVLDKGVAKTYVQSERMETGGFGHFNQVYIDKKHLDRNYKDLVFNKERK